MAEAHNGSMVPSKAVGTPRDTGHLDTYTLWAIFLGVIFIGAITAVVVTAMQGMGTLALIIALFTAAFFSRVGC
jgi:hypothetical protein